MTVADGLMCYSGWTKYGSRCYQQVGTAMTYSAAKKKCEDMQANMLVVETQDEYDVVGGKSAIMLCCS